MTEHTPGPWKVLTGKREGQDFLEVSDADGLRVIAECPGRNQIGNAALIAAAPELLEACKAAFISLPMSKHNETTNELLKSAIAKAEGGVA